MIKSIYIDKSDKIDDQNIGTTLKYLDLVQLNDKIFNEEQKRKRDEFVKKHGENELNKIIYSNKHHPLKSIRTKNYNLTDEEIKNLTSNGVLFKSTTTETFGKCYLDLYNHNMPVIITSDCMLYALHNFYDNTLERIEKKKLINHFSSLCEKMLVVLHKNELTDINCMKQLELIFLIPYLILNSRKTINENTEKLFTDFNKIITIDKLPKMEKVLSKSNDMEKNRNKLSDEDKSKLKLFVNYHLGETNFTKTNFIESFNLMKCVFINDDYYRAFQLFEDPIISKNINVKYNSEKELIKILTDIFNYNDINIKFKIECYETDLKFNGTTFKPRGHYNNSRMLQNYFMAFTWLSSLNIKFDNNVKNEYNAGLILATMLAKLAEPIKNDVIIIEKFVHTIIGKPDGYSLSSFLDEINNIIPRFDNLEETYNWIKKEDNINRIKLSSSNNCKVSKFGDTFTNKIFDEIIDKTDNEIKSSFSIIGKGLSIDTIILKKLVDDEFQENTLTGPRKYPSIFDLVYVLFNNDSAMELAKKRMNCNHFCGDEICFVKDSEFKFRDGYDYEEYLIKLHNEIEIKTKTKSLWDQKLTMIKSLTSDKKYLESKGLYPFYTHSWDLKQAQTQIGHYSDIRHDNVLYVYEGSGVMMLCEYPDLLVEPSISFWNEYYNTLLLLETLIDPEDIEALNILKNFKNITLKIKEFVNCYVNGINPNEILVSELKSIISIEHFGSGSPSYGGWYVKLFYDKNESTEYKPEVCSIFTAPPDERDSGGIVHLGTGSVNLMYVVANNKIFLGPTYSTYEIITDYNKRYNDDEWKKECYKYFPLDFNL